MSVSRETLLASYADLILKWNRTIRLVGVRMDRKTLDAEVSDALHLRSHLHGGTVGDLGSGNGLPAVPLAIAEPDRRFVLIEADRRKAAFLNAVRRDLKLANISVRAGRIEDQPSLKASTITARALAPLARLLDLALPHVGRGGRMVFSKGSDTAREIAEARRRYDFDLRIDEVPDGRGCVLTVTDAAPLA